jgi:uncharacterized protein YecT (DUF1311 family)
MPREQRESRPDSRSEALYRGLSAPRAAPQPPPAPPPERAEPKRKVSDLQVLIGGGAAVIIGLAAGLWARPSLFSPEPAPAKPAAAAPRLEVAQLPPAPPPPVPADKLEVLPPDMAAAGASGAGGRAQLEAAPPPDEPPDAPARPSPAPAEIAPAPPVIAASPPPVAAPAQTARIDCAAAGGLADQMVCADPGLRDADREMTRAYRRALRVAPSPGALRADQRDWLAIREEAAHHSQRALAQVYQQRIDELNDAAYEDGDAPDPGY